MGSFYVRPEDLEDFDFSVNPLEAEDPLSKALTETVFDFLRVNKEQWFQDFVARAAVTSSQAAVFQYGPDYVADETDAARVHATTFCLGLNVGIAIARMRFEKAGDADG